MSYPIPANEKKRLEALRLYQALDATPDQAFQDIAAIAAQIANAPVALISLVGKTHERYEANIGFTGNGVPRQESFCTHTILGTEALVVEDATADARFAQNPHVTKAGGVRFYAGAPIVDREGHGLGSVCVVDTKPRQLAPDKVDVLMRLARTAMRLLEQRRLSTKLAEALEEVKTVQGLLCICSHCKDIRVSDDYWSRVDEYFSTHTDALFSHGLCPVCFEREYPEIYHKLKAEGKL